MWFCITGCTSNAPWNFHTDYFSIEINEEGYITSMANRTVLPHREFSPSDKPSPLMTLYDSEQQCYYKPQKASYEQLGNVLTLSYSNGSVAKIRLTSHDKYLKMQLVSLEPRNNIDVIQWGTYYTNITNLLGEIIGVARDTSMAVNYSIGVLALDDNTLGGTADVDGDAAPFQYIIHSPDAELYPLPNHLHEGQVFSLGGDGVSDVAFYANKEPYYRIMYGNAALVDEKGQIYLNYHSRDRSKKRTIAYSLIPNMPANIPNHIEVEPVPGVDLVGSSIALWGSPDSTALMDVIQAIVLSEGLPYPTINGKWIKDPTAYVPDVRSVGNQYDSLISYTSRLGFSSIYANDQGFLRPDRGNEGYLDGKNAERKTFRFSNGNKSHKEFAELAAKENLMLGRVCITNALAPGTKDASPVPNDSLCFQLQRVLMNNLSPNDTIITVDNPQYLEEIGSWEGHCPNLNIIKIGKELIHYMGVSHVAPYTLQHVTRGYWGTEPTAHQKGDSLYKLQVTINYGYDGLIPNLFLQDQIAEYYADVSLNSGVCHYDFDGQEFLFNNGHGYYSVKRFFRKMFDRAKTIGVPYIRFSGATLSEGSWHYQSVWNVGGGKNLYDVDRREWGSTTSQGKDMRDVTYSNYFPVSFGSNFAIKDTSTVRQYEHIEALSVGYGATYYLPLSQQDVEKCPQKDQIFKAIRTWEKARSANAFPSYIRRKLMNAKFDWTLEELEDGNNWILYRLEDGKKCEKYLLRGKDE